MNNDVRKEWIEFDEMQIIYKKVSLNYPSAWACLLPTESWLQTCLYLSSYSFIGATDPTFHSNL